MRIAAAAFVALAAAAAPAAAQDHSAHAQGGAAAAVPAMCMLGGGSHGTGHEGGAMPEMTVWAHEFMMYQHHGAEFGLTADQTARIERIRTAAQTSCAHHVRMSDEAKAAAITAFGRANPDMPAFEAKIGEASQHVAMAHVAIAKAANEAFAVLNATQREKALAERAEHTAAAKGAGHTGH